MLSKGRVQQEAITQLTRLPIDDALRANALELLYNLQANLQANLANSPEGDEEDKELVMAILPLFEEQLQAAQQQGLQKGLEQGLERGLQQGLERGRKEQQRLILENFLQVRFGTLDEKLAAFCSTLCTLSATEFTAILLSLSGLTSDAEGRQQGMRLLAEKIVQVRGPELGERLPIVVTALLELPLDRLLFLLEQLPQLSTTELINFLEERQE